MLSNSIAKIVRLQYFKNSFNVSDDSLGLLLKGNDIQIYRPGTHSVFEKDSFRFKNPLKKIQMAYIGSGIYPIVVLITGLKDKDHIKIDLGINSFCEIKPITRFFISHPLEAVA